MPQTLSSWTYFSPALIECSRQLNASSQPDSYKLCILMTDGINNDNDEYIYPPDSLSGVGQWCVSQNITTKSITEIDACIVPNDLVSQRPGVPPANSCTGCVESADAHCASNAWDAACLAGCESTTCAKYCKGACTTQHIADKLHGETDIKMAGVLVSGSIAESKLERATATVKQVSSCKNETELAMGKCPFFVEVRHEERTTHHHHSFQLVVSLRPTTSTSSPPRPLPLRTPSPPRLWRRPPRRRRLCAWEARSSSPSSSSPSRCSSTCSTSPPRSPSGRRRTT